MSVAVDYDSQFAVPAELVPAESVPFWPVDHQPDRIPFWPVDPADRAERDRARVRSLAGPAEVVPLRRSGSPIAVPEAPPLRLTRRGMAVVALAVAALCAGLVWIGLASAPGSSGTAGSVGTSATASTVVVQDGDTLWSIASRVAPGQDPRAEVAGLQKLNHLTGVQLTPGQTLRTR